MTDILTTADIVRLSGWSMQRVQALCRTGQLPAKDISLGGKKARYIIRRCDWEAFITPNNAKPESVKPAGKRSRIDAHVKDKVFG